MLVSMLVRFFLLRFKPSPPSPGEFRALGLESVESDERFSEKNKVNTNKEILFEYTAISCKCSSIVQGML